MRIDAQRISHLLDQPADVFLSGELRREGDVFFIGADLPPRVVLETIFSSDCRSPVELFSFTFPDLAAFARMEETVRAVRKNFRGYLLGNFHFSAAAAVVDQAYAAGLDHIDLPHSAFGNAPERESWLAAIDYARTVFPRWGVLSTLNVDAQPLQQFQSDIDLLLEHSVLPMLLLTPAASAHAPNEIAFLFACLQQGWRRTGALLKPLQPLLSLKSPFVTPPPRRGIGGLLDRLEDVRLRTVSDLRRRLRVREVEESFESAGL